MSFRKQGGLAFGHVQDEAGRMQFFRKNRVRSSSTEQGTIGYAEISLIDLGDIVEATGTLIRTERGEISLMVDRPQIIKSLRPLPDKWAGLKDREAILRRRYLDTTLENRAGVRPVPRMVAAIR